MLSPGEPAVAFGLASCPRWVPWHLHLQQALEPLLGAVPGGPDSLMRTWADGPGENRFSFALRT